MGNKLGRLRRLRNNVDYKLGWKASTTLSNDAIVLAEEVINRI